MKDDLSRTGYGQEDEYFYKLNKELIDQRRKEREAAKATEKRGPHWLKCPKCGSDMKVQELCKIEVELCTKCEGMFLDHGELEMLLKAKEPETFIKRLKSLF